MSEIQTKTAFEPAPIPTGIEMLGGRQYMRDGRQALMSVSVIKPADKLQDEMVRKTIGFAKGLSDQISRFKEHAMGDVLSLDQLLEQEYGVVRKGNAEGGKGNRTYMSYDTLYRVTVQVSDNITFGPELHIAKAIIDECMTEWSANARPEIQAIITRAFNTDKEGQINRSEIFMLLRLDIADERWKRAMDAIRDAIRVVSRKEYIRFSERPHSKAEWTSITIDLAQA